MAGYRTDNAITVFYGIKIVMALVLPILAFLFLWDSLGSNPALRMMVVLFSGAAGFVLPNSMLRRRVRARQEVLRLSLPDALDLLVISVEAGLGLDQAIQHVGKELALSHPEVSEELSSVSFEMRAGKRRSEALRNLAERTGEPELRKLVAILIQNDRFGTSMSESLRNHSDFMRTRRRQEAEERAAKVGVKLVFPIFFFILPSMLVVSAGPGLLQIFKNLFPMMRQFR
jgi:tight adherence protein C